MRTDKLDCRLVPAEVCISFLQTGSGTATCTSLKTDPECLCSAECPEQSSCRRCQAITARNAIAQQRAEPGVLLQVLQLAAGDQHSAALTASGFLFTWGCNDQGQLGLPAVAEHMVQVSRPE